MSVVSVAYRRTAALMSVSLFSLVALEIPAIVEGAIAEELHQVANETAAAEAPGEQKGEAKVKVSDKSALTPSATVNLVNLLREQGVLTQEQADSIIPQLDDETFVTRQAVNDANTKAEEAAKAATAAASAAMPAGSRRVSYVPESVKRQMRDEIRKEVMSQAKNEGWASPGAYPEWASRIRFHGDIRGRFEGQFFPGGGYNATDGQMVDFNSINTGSAYDLSDLSNPFINAPLYNTTEDRQRFRLRARLGMDADLADGFTAGMRLATGSDNSPVSTNQTVGSSGGNFSKYAIWLDRAYLKYKPEASPFDYYGLLSNMTLSVGRFNNPFWGATDLVWDADLGFDGAALQATRELRQGFTMFAVAGAFPIFNTALDFSSTEATKFESDDKYLLGGQVGFNWQATSTVAFTLGASVFDYSNVKGELSKPCDLTRSRSCSTDALRPSFAQKGNTYTLLRDIIPTPENNSGKEDQFQYFGLASDFRPLVVSGRLDFGNFHPVHVVVDGEFVWNTAFNVNGKYAQNNLGPDTTGPGDDNYGPFEGGDIGWMAKLTIGHQAFTRFGDWDAHIGYKYLESDATLDAFVDSDFGLGGTNLKGYFLGASFALSKSVTTSATWMSANSIAGAPYAVDLLQVDLNAKF